MAGVKRRVPASDMCLGVGAFACVMSPYSAEWRICGGMSVVAQPQPQPHVGSTYHCVSRWNMAPVLVMNSVCGSCQPRPAT